MTLGLVTEKNGLAAARTAAQDARGLIAKGVDPIDDRRRPDAPTFDAAARELIKVMAPSWRGRDTKARWERCLLRYAAKLGPRRVDEITAADVLAVMRTLWTRIPESAAKTRECIERVLDAQRAAGAIRGAWENPARWKGHLALALPKRQEGEHHPAMPYADVPAFMAQIRTQNGMGARALEFTILTVAREGMSITARWPEIVGDVWVVPRVKMKSGKDFRVPLSPAALALLERVAVAGRRGYIFPGQRQKGRPAPHISDATMDAVLKRMELPFVPHGFRTSFRDWAGDETDHAREVAEEAMAHVVGDETERAYRRSDALVKRRRLMEDWATFLAGPDEREEPPHE